ncbi:MAG TPA: hypothetical protein VHS09_14965 [Polyangiaceae bacterium]|jgi:hypothetical protein|nr:hypothetical protein [Polyangiaceae bacterium]
MMAPLPPMAPNPYAPPQAPYGAYPAGPPGYAAPPPRVEGDRLIVGKAYTFPACCVKCGATGTLGARAQKFAWFPSWTYLLLLTGLLPMVICQLVLTKRAQFLLPLCGPCRSRWTMARVLRSLAILGPLLGGLGLAILGAASDTGWLAAAGLLLFFAGVLVVLPIDLVLVRRRTVRAVFIDDRMATLKGIAPQVLDALARG